MHKITISMIIILIVTVFAIGCNLSDIEENNAELGQEMQEDIPQNYGDIVEEGEVYNWTGEILDIDKHNNQEGYSMVRWSGVEGGGSFTIKDSLVYEKYNLKVGEYIDVVAQNNLGGLEIISIERIEKRTQIKGFVEKIEITGNNSKIYIKGFDRKKYKDIITINTGKDTEFIDATIEKLKKGDIIRAKGILEDKTLNSYEVILESALITH